MGRLAFLDERLASQRVMGRREDTVSWFDGRRRMSGGVEPIIERHEIHVAISIKVQGLEFIIVCNLRKAVADVAVETGPEILE